MTLCYTDAVQCAAVTVIMLHSLNLTPEATTVPFPPNSFYYVPLRPKYLSLHPHLCLSLSIKDQFSQPYKRSGKIKITHILIYCSILEGMRHTVDRSVASPLTSVCSEFCNVVSVCEGYFRNVFMYYMCIYRCADKSLARPGRKQATATEDFDVHISYL